jgi:hypothetical protein
MYQQMKKTLFPLLYVFNNARTSPVENRIAFCNWNSRNNAFSGAAISFSIFIASSINRISPFLTVRTGCHSHIQYHTGHRRFNWISLPETTGAAGVRGRCRFVQMPPVQAETHMLFLPFRGLHIVA